MDPLSTISAFAAVLQIVTHLQTVWQTRTSSFARKDRAEIRDRLGSLFEHAYKLCEAVSDIRPSGRNDVLLAFHASLTHISDDFDRLVKKELMRRASSGGGSRWSSRLRTKKEDRLDDEITYRLKYIGLLLSLAQRTNSQHVSSTDEKYRLSRSTGPFVHLPPVRLTSRLHLVSEPTRLPRDSQLTGDSVYATRHARYCEERIKGTCEWFEKKKAYQEWLTSPSQCVLWCHGSAGVGKSTLMSHVVESFKKHRKCAYFYLGYGKVQDDIDVADAISQQLRDSHEQAGSEDQATCESSLKRYEGLRKALKDDASIQDSTNRVHLFIDAWDKENMKNEQGFADLFNTILTSKCKVLVFSRQPAPTDLARDSAHCRSFEITSQDNSRDMRILIDLRISQSLLLQDACQVESTREQLIRYTLESADGKYFRCEAQLSNMLLKQNSRQLRDMIQTPRESSDTDDVVEPFLNAILTQEGSDKAIAQRTLIWLSSISQPLHCVGLCQALTIADTLERGADAAHSLPTDLVFTPETVHRSCKGLVRLETDSNTISLFDYEVEYQVGRLWGHNKDVDYEKHLSELRDACLEYLLLDAFADGPCTTAKSLRIRMETWPFLAYAACNWLSNLSQASDEKLMRLMNKFLSSPKHVQSAAQVLFWCEDDNAREDDTFAILLKRSENVTSFRLVQVLGLLGLLDSQSRKPDKLHNLDSTDRESYTNRLVWCLTGSVSLVSGDGTIDWQTPKERAMSIFGPEGIETLLFSDEFIFCKYKQPILTWAIDQNRAATVRRVLDAWDSPGSSHSPTPNSLHFAVNRKNPSPEVVASLLWSCSPNTRMSPSPLQVACKHGHTQIANLLVQHGALLGAPDSKEAPPLHLAIRQGATRQGALRQESIDTVRLLVARGADTFKDPSNGATALHVAVEVGDEEMVRLMLANALDVRPVDTAGKVPRDYTTDSQICRLLDLSEALKLHE